MKTIISFFGLGLFILLGSSCQEKPERTNATDTKMTATAGLGQAVNTEDLVKQGAYLVGIMGCSDCHTPLKMTPQGPAPDMDRYLSGHPAEIILPAYDPSISKNYVLFDMTNTAAIGPWGTSFSANLTPDETGIGTWTEAQFTRAIREGKFKGMENGRTLLPPMPWQGYSALKDQDVKAIFTYLQSIKPVKNVVPATTPPIAISRQ